MKESSAFQENLKVLLKDSQNSRAPEDRDINHNNTLSSDHMKKKMVIDTENENTISFESAKDCSTPRIKSLFTSTLNWSNSSSDQEKDSSVFYSTAFQDEAENAVRLLRDYVVCRLKRSGLTSKICVTEYAPTKNPILRHRMLSAGLVFEKQHPNLFNHISRKLGYCFDSEPTVRRLYFRLATHLMGVDSRNFTWGRILALFCLAGAVAMDCISQGHPTLVEEVVKISSDFIKQNVLEWIVNHGGWVAMAEHFTKSRAPKKSFWVLPMFKDPALPMTTAGLIAFSILSFLGLQLLV